MIRGAIIGFGKIAQTGHVPAYRLAFMPCHQYRYSPVWRPFKEPVAATGQSVEFGEIEARSATPQ
jgi:predicted dehydrogenase